MAISQFQQHVLKKDLKKERHRRNQWRQVILTKSISDPFGLKASQEKSDYSDMKGADIFEFYYKHKK